MTIDERWFKNAVFYAVSVPHFFDADGDGVGDVAGVHRRLDHVVSLGATCVWLLPFVESPRRDFGYDITDHYSVDRRFGDLGDVAELVQGAHQRNLRVIVDLPLQHTSVDHPWFQAARRGRDDTKHDYYVWRDERPDSDDGPESIVWQGDDRRPWTFDEQAGRWYQHRFYSHQPDLNVLNADVRAELHRVLRFWLQLGVDGVRIDAGSHLTRAAAPAYDGDELAFLRELRQTAAVQSPDAVLMIEADVDPAELGDYFDGSDGGVLLFNFFLASHIFLALARASATPLAEALARMPPATPAGQWANFLRNHDELDLDQLAEDEREEVLDRFAPEPEMRIFDNGIRRRLGPMLGGDGRLLRLAYAALMALPGSPVLVWGDELPLGEDLERPDRASVRMAMPWTPRDDLGFSAKSEVPPQVATVPDRDRRLNVADARREEGSLLNWLAAALRAREEAAHIGWGIARVLPVEDDRVLAIRHDWQGEAVVAICNFADEPCRVRPPGCDDLVDSFETFADHDYEPDDQPLDSELALDPLGYRWFRAREGG